MLVLDNSAYSLNGDYPPTRLAAQADAVHILFNNKLNANPENEVGLMVMGGKAPEVLVTPTQDEGKLIAALHETKQGGLADLSTGIQVAQLALKHRQNKNQRQRIIVFVGSPLTDSTASLVKLGKKMKKNNVAIDIISFGSALDASPAVPSSSSTPTEPAESNETKLLALHEAVNSSDNSHFLAVEAGPHLLSERIAMSAIMRRGGDDGDDGGAPGGGGGDEYGVDPNLDPELAMALRMSLEEERARQAASAPAAAAPTLESVPEASTPAVPAAAAAPAAVPATPVAVEKDAAAQAAILAGAQVEDVGMGGDDEDADLAMALALSRGEDDVDMDDASGGAEDDEDAEIARAIAMSMKEAEENDK